MNDPLQTAVDAHGGLKRWNEVLKRWNEVKTITVAAAITEAIWMLKGQPDYLTVPTHTPSPGEFDA